MLAKRHADWGIMSQSDYFRLCGIAVKIDNEQVLADSDLAWAERRLESRPLKDNASTRATLHTFIMLPLLGLKVWKGSHALRLLAMARYLIAQDNRFDSSQAIFALERIPNVEATSLLLKLTKSADPEVRNLAAKVAGKRIRHFSSHKHP